MCVWYVIRQTARLHGISMVDQREPKKVEVIEQLQPPQT
jgi:hypothetical protein